MTLWQTAPQNFGVSMKLSAAAELDASRMALTTVSRTTTKVARLTWASLKSRRGKGRNFLGQLAALHELASAKQDPHRHHHQPGYEGARQHGEPDQADVGILDDAEGFENEQHGQRDARHRGQAKARQSQGVLGIGGQAGRARERATWARPSWQDPIIFGRQLEATCPECSAGLLGGLLKRSAEWSC
jgi:hypothetical protein